MNMVNKPKRARGGKQTGPKVKKTPVKPDEKGQDQDQASPT